MLTAVVGVIAATAAPAGAITATVAPAAAGTAPTAPAPGQGRGGIGSAYSMTVGPVVLPSTAACRASRTLRVQLHHSDGRRPVLVRLSVAGHRLATSRRRMRDGAFEVRVPSRGRYTVSVTVRLGRGRAARSITVRGRYRACATT